MDRAGTNHHFRIWEHGPRQIRSSPTSPHVDSARSGAIANYPGLLPFSRLRLQDTDSGPHRERGASPRERGALRCDPVKSVHGLEGHHSISSCRGCVNDAFVEASARRRMRQIRQANTDIETAIAAELRRLGYEFECNVRAEPSIRSRPDFVFRDHRVAVYVDGCFWHGCPAHFTVPMTRPEWWVSKIDSNRERDSRSVVALADAGWSVVRAWSHERPPEVASRVFDLLARPCRN
jgi:DNA mismatch endonuclease (patch repair protein)